MADESNDRDAAPGSQQPALRARTFLKGIVYYDNRHVSIECTIRDLSDTGARLVFSTQVTVPDAVELHIPQKHVTLPARVRRRELYEIGVSFEDQRSSEPRRTTDGDLAERVTKIESEIAAMSRLLKQLKSKVLPNDGDIG